jgi:histidine-containing phosphotransfer peotein
MLRDKQRADVESQLATINAQIEQLLYKLGQEGLLDDQFAQLMQLQDDQNPNFVAEVVDLYFVDSEQKLIKLEAKLAEPVVDFNDVDQLVHQFKGSSASFGAQTIAAICYSVILSIDVQSCDSLVASDICQFVLAVHECVSPPPKNPGQGIQPCLQNCSCGRDAELAARRLVRNGWQRLKIHSPH